MGPFLIFAVFCREPGVRCSRCAVEGFGGKRREIAVKMGFCGDMVGDAGCGEGSWVGGAAGGELVVDRGRAEKLKRPWET